MSIRMGSVVHNVADIDRGIAFWSAVLGLDVKYRDVDFAILRGEHVNLSLQLSPEPKQGPNRVHLDLYTDDREAEAERIQALGATFVRREVDDDGGFVTLLDPDGNEFCVCG